jgi:phage terminase small subunit
MFAQECAAGKNTNESYVLAGFASNRSNANNLRRKKAIATRIAELLEQRERKAEKAEERAIERAAITKEKVLSELAKIGFANMMDYMKIGPSGDPVLDYSALTRDQAAALVEVTVEDFKDGRGDDARDVRRVKFKLADKKSALIDLGKELGLFIERRETGKPGEFASLKDDEVQREIRDELRRAGISDSIAHALARGEETAGSEPERG